jgi:2-oxoglutarate ferredoxin oxidoreductase subunit beta
VLYDIIRAAYHHKGLSFVRILQRCPEWLPDMFEPFMHDPMKTRLLTHEKGLKLSANLSKVYKNQEQHDPSDIHRAREIASDRDPIPVGILYHNPEVPVYEELRNAGQQRSTRYIKSGFESELDKFTVWPQGADKKVQPSA